MVYSFNRVLKKINSDGVIAIYSVLLVGISWYVYPLSNERGRGNGNENIFTSASLKVQASREALFLKQTRILHSVILGLESVLFGLFVFAIGCDQFEAIFLEMLLKQARDSKLTDGLFENQADDNFVQLFDRELAKSSSEKVDIGIAEAIINQMALHRLEK